MRGRGIYIDTPPLLLYILLLLSKIRWISWNSWIRLGFLRLSDDAEPELNLEQPGPNLDRGLSLAETRAHRHPLEISPRGLLQPCESRFPRARDTSETGSPDIESRRRGQAANQVRDGPGVPPATAPRRDAPACQFPRHAGQGQPCGPQFL